MNNEDQEDAEASGAGLRSQQGGLAVIDGRALGERARPIVSRWRLKRSVEIFETKNGTIHLLRLGSGDDLEIEDPSEADRSIVRELADRFSSASELQARTGLEASHVESALTALMAAGVLEKEARAALLSPSQAERYDRQLIYFADLEPIGRPARLQKALTEAHVLLIGCGGLGSWLACGLAAAGVGALTLVDDDRVELSNLNRQLLFKEVDIGRLKVEAAAEALREHNHELEVTTVVERIRSTRDVEALLSERPDLVIATADWPPHDLPRWVNQACLRQGVPWLGAGQFPPKLRVGPLVIPGQTPCLACQEQQIRQEHPLYDELADWRAQGHTPDASVGPVTAVIGSLLASEALHLLLGVFSPASAGRSLLLDLQTMRLEHVVVRSDPDCSLCRQAAATSLAGDRRVAA